MYLSTGKNMNYNLLFSQQIILIHKDVEAHIQESSTSNTKLPMSS